MWDLEVTVKSEVYSLWDATTCNVEEEFANREDEKYLDTKIAENRELDETMSERNNQGRKVY